MTGAALRARRQALGLTQVQLARLLEVSSTSVARWERDAVPIKRPHALTLLLDQIAARAAAEKQA